MTTPLQAILWSASCIAKQNLISDVVCPQCGERRLVIKWGCYHRYLFNGDQTAAIQRFRCLNGHCSRFTFSVLPHPFLPVLRMPLCFLLALLSLHQKGYSIARLAREAGKRWAVVRRCLTVACRVKAFLNNEFADIGFPCLQPSIVWTALTQRFSWAFFPNRF
jgi:transposase-like protein